MKVNAQRQVIALAAMQNYTADMRAKGLSANSAAMRYLDKVDKHAVGVSKEYASELVDTLQAACPKFFGMIENDDAVAGILAEISGVDTKNADYKKAAQAWIQCTEKIPEDSDTSRGDSNQFFSHIFNFAKGRFPAGSEPMSDQIPETPDTKTEFPAQAQTSPLVAPQPDIKTAPDYLAERLGKEDLIAQVEAGKLSPEEALAIAKQNGWRIE